MENTFTILGTSIVYSLISKFTIFITIRCQNCKLVDNHDNPVVFKIITTNRSILTILISKVVVVVNRLSF